MELRLAHFILCRKILQNWIQEMSLLDSSLTKKKSEFLDS